MRHIIGHMKLMSNLILIVINAINKDALKKEFQEEKPAEETKSSKKKKKQAKMGDKAVQKSRYEEVTDVEELIRQLESALEIIGKERAGNEEFVKL